MGDVQSGDIIVLPDLNNGHNWEYCVMNPKLAMPFDTIKRATLNRATQLSRQHLNRATHPYHLCYTALPHLAQTYRIQCDALESCCKFQVRTGKHCNMYSGLQYKYKLISNTNLLNLSIFFF